MYCILYSVHLLATANRHHLVQQMQLSRYYSIYSQHLCPSLLPPGHHLLLERLLYEARGTSGEQLRCICLLYKGRGRLVSPPPLLPIPQVGSGMHF